MNKDDKNKDDIVYEENTSKSDKNDLEVDSDVVPEEENEAPQALIKKLKEKLKACEKDKQEYMNGWQRERADFINFKKRCEAEKLETIKFANESLISEILPVLDSFEMAFANKESWEKVDKNWRVGVEYIYTQLKKILEENGLTEMNPLGEKFDPKYHIAEEHKIIEDEKQDGVVLSVKKKGYMLNDRVLIAPQVVVGELKN